MKLDRFFTFRNKLNENTEDDTDIPTFDDDLVEIFIDDKEERDSITISNRLLNRLKELKEDNRDPKIKVGDKVVIKNNQKGKLSDGAYNFIKNREVFDVIKINSKGKLDIGYYKYYIREDGKKIKKIFYYSPRRFEKMNQYDKVSLFLISLKDIKKSDLVKNPLDFLDVDNKGNFSFLSRRFYDGGDAFKSNKRQETNKITRMLLRITTKEYFDNMLDQKDIEIFMNKWRLLFDDSYNVSILEGDDILDAYNGKKISSGWFNSSCANFKDIKNVNTNIYKVYTENRENIKCLVVYHKGKIYGRRMMFTGTQSKTHGKFKEGDSVILLNGMYGEGGRNSKPDQLMKRWANDNGATLISETNGTDIIRMKIQNTKYKLYPPWDSMYVNFETDEIASTLPRDEQGKWFSAYNASYLG